MQRDLQIIGNEIRFYGYTVGTLSDIVPHTVRAKFEERLNANVRTLPNPLEFNRSEPRRARR